MRGAGSALENQPHQPERPHSRGDGYQHIQGTVRHNQTNDPRDQTLRIMTQATSCGPCGRATQCSLPSGCQPFSGGIVYPPGIIVVFHFVFLFLYSVSHNQVFWRDVRSVVKLLLFESNPPVGTLTPSATEEQSSSIYRSMP